MPKRARVDALFEGKDAGQLTACAMRGMALGLKVLCFCDCAAEHEYKYKFRREYPVNIQEALKVKVQELN